MKRPISVESAKDEIRATVARALSNALITGIDNASEEGHPLSQVQQIHVATMTIMAYSEALDACRNMDFEADVLVPNAHIFAESR